jgi:hypothetical protein
MNQSIIIAIVAAVAGLVAGAFAVRSTTEASTPSQQSGAASELSGMKKAAEDARALANGLADENSELRAELAGLKRALEQTSLSLDAATTVAEPVAAVTEEVAEPEPAEVSEEQEGRRRGPGGGEGGFDRTRWGGTEEEREQWRQEREERRAAMWDDAYAEAGDDEDKAAVAVLEDQMDYLGSLREEMRDAETDEDRDAVRDEMRQAWEDTRSFMEEQQERTLKDLAKEHGITKSEDQEAFVSALKQTQDESVFFQGGGRGGFGGGRGGPRGGR